LIYLLREGVRPHRGRHDHKIKKPWAFGCPRLFIKKKYFNPWADGSPKNKNKKTPMLEDLSFF
jgi:hypothetical protein